MSVFPLQMRIVIAVTPPALGDPGDTLALDDDASELSMDDDSTVLALD